MNFAIVFDKYDVLTIMGDILALAHSSSQKSSNGRSIIGTRHFSMLSVKRARHVPMPATSKSASIFFFGTL